ncbi:MAG TPA: hypothetical protein VN081_06615 [Dongiaceae bacterium]|nr:hypothetical protein [Dongiaceae bacterium]
MSEQPLQPDPHKDGLDHVNAWSKGRTPLGRALSNFAPIGFMHPHYGHFASIEGFWYFLGTGCQHEDLRRLHGYAAKQQGCLYEQVPIENFDGLIEDAVVFKIEQHPNLLSAVLHNTLPVYHYYVYGENPYRIVNKTDQIDFLTNAIQRLREKYPTKDLR